MDQVGQSSASFPHTTIHTNLALVGQGWATFLPLGGNLSGVHADCEQEGTKSVPPINLLPLSLSLLLPPSLSLSLSATFFLLFLIGWPCVLLSEVSPLF